MSESKLAVQTAFFQALNVPLVTAAGQLFQHVPEKVDPPFFVIDAITIEPIGGKDGGLDRVTVDIITVFRGARRAGLYELQAKAKQAVEAGLPPQAGFTMTEPLLEADEDETLEDGVTYLGTHRWSLIVQADD